MKKEIGSFYESVDHIDMNHDDVSLRQWLIENSGHENIEFVSSGRDAISYVLEQIECNNEKEKICMLPMYTCDSVIIPFQKAGWSTYFYPIGKKFETDRNEFQKLLSDIKPKVLLMHTYYGIDNLSNVRDIISEYQKNKKIIFIEDMTQSLALMHRSQIADYCIGSLRKWFPIPDGGFVSSNNYLKKGIRAEKSDFIILKKKAQDLKLQYLKNKSNISKTEILNMNRKAEEILDQNAMVCSMSDYSHNLLKVFDFKEMLHKRNENAKYLTDQIKKMRKIQTFIDVQDESPLYVPIFAEDRKKLQKYLISKDIYAPILWEIPPCVHGVLQYKTEYVYSHLLALPCDHRYLIDDMKRISQELLQYDMELK